MCLSVSQVLTSRTGKVRRGYLWTCRLTVNKRHKLMNQFYESHGLTCLIHKHDLLVNWSLSSLGLRNER